MVNGKVTPLYNMPGYNSNSKVLEFKNIVTPLNVSSGYEMRIWYGEDFVDKSEGDNNEEKTCVDVYGKFGCG